MLNIEYFHIILGISVMLLYIFSTIFAQYFLVTSAMSRFGPNMATLVFVVKTKS